MPFIPRRSPDPMLYFVLADFGASGRAWVERAVGSMGLNDTIRDIREGQIECVVTVLECSLEGPVCRDVTEDVLRKAGRWSDDAAPLTGQDLIDWRRDRARGLLDA